MLKFKILNIIKYKLVRIIEKNPSINLMVYNNIKYFKFLLPHEKDYLGMKKICKNNLDEVIIDIGANLGISTMGFRQMGFKNKICIFEPNPEIYNKYLLPIKKNYKNIILKNLALGHKNQKKFFFVPYYKNEAIHYFGSFDKKYIINSLKITFAHLLSKINLKKKIINIIRYDDLNLKFKPHFIKIDVEGYDHFVLKGLSKTIKKHKPIFLIEYNKENFFKIKKYLKNYEKFIYDIELDKLVKLKQNLFKNTISRSSKINLLSSRNIYFIPK
jgi:FkbM family methyltransferase